MKKLPAVKGGVAGCLNCGVAHDVLPLDTVLYYGFGGWRVTCDRRQIYPPMTKASGYQDVRRLKSGEMAVYDKRLQVYEFMAARTRGKDWRATFESPLHGETYQRQGRAHWVLVERNQGFA